jgi:hypothetical protein
MHHFGGTYSYTIAILTQHILRLLPIQPILTLSTSSGTLEMHHVGGTFSYTSYINTSYTSYNTIALLTQHILPIITLPILPLLIRSTPNATLHVHHVGGAYTNNSYTRYTTSYTYTTYTIYTIITYTTSANTLNPQRYPRDA